MTDKTEPAGVIVPTSPAPIGPADPDHIHCDHWHLHQHQHVRDGRGWRCPICSPRPGEGRQ